MLFSLLILLILAYLAWPYYQLYRLGQALRQDNRQELRRIVDMEAIRWQFKQMLSRNIEDFADRYESSVIKFLRGGVKELSGSALDAIDLDWVRDMVLATQRQNLNHRGSYLPGGFSFAFFETPTRFLVRVGELGEHPLHFYMTLQDWRWRVTAVFL